MIWIVAKDLDLPEFWPYGRLKGPKIENEALRNNVLSSLCPMDENLGRHEQVLHIPNQESRREGWTDARSAVGFCLGSGLFGSYNSD